ncbi:MAG: ATP-binding protein [Myxococcota bacterium]
MSVLAAVLVAWSWVYGYLCAYYVLLYRRRRADGEYLNFGLLCGAMSLYVFLDACLLVSEDIEMATLAQRANNVPILAGVAFFVEFQAHLTRRRDRFVRATYGYTVVGIVFTLLGLMFEPVEAEPIWSYGSRVAPLPTLTVLGWVYLAGTTLIALIAVIRLFQREPDDRDPLRGTAWSWLIAGAGGLCLVASVHDLFVRAGLLNAYPLVDHAFMVFAGAVSYALLDRFVRTRSELEDRTAELGRSYAELRDTQQRLVRQEQLAAVGELSAVIAHEIRNPLAVIKNAVSGLRRDDLAEEDQTTLVGILNEETGRLNRLMHDLLAYARPVVPQGRTLRVEELVERSVERAMSGVAYADQIEVAYELEGPAEVYGDPELLRHAFVNVVENALQAMPTGGRLTVASKAARAGDADAVEIRFVDTGEGMDTLVRGKARDPFFTTRPAGTGLGLAIVERVLRNHGGEVQIESRHGVGTTITFVVPCERTDAALPSPESTARRLSAIQDLQP